MQQTYTHILTFLLKHQYFNDELFRSIQISYDEDTYKLIRDLGIIIKPFPGGLYLLASDPELLDSINGTSPLQLYLNCSDPLYVNYTELPLYRLPDKLLYFNNLSVIPDSKSQGFIMHNDDFAGSDDIVQLSNGKIQVRNFNADNEYFFSDAAGNQIPAHCITKSAQESGIFFISNLPQGIVVVDDNKTIERFYYYPKAVWKKPFGIVEIFTNELYKQYDPKKEEVEYSLSFKNRETIWKYFFVSPVYQKFKNLSIINKVKEQIFNPPQLKQVNNTDALVLESKNKIPLVELSDENYQLVDNFESGNGKSKIILKNLIKASPEQLFRDETKPTEIYSHIYI